MTGDQLVEKLLALTPEQRKLNVETSYWTDSDADSSGWEERKDIDDLTIASSKPYFGQKEEDIILLT